MKSDSALGQSDIVSDFSESTDPDLIAGDYWAVIGAFSRDWVNYRHQADALTMYTFLKEKGVPDDHIILLVFDDIPLDRRNLKPGEVYHTPGEEEVRKQANPDYIGKNVNKQMLMDILTGSGIENNEPLLRSNENSTVLVYLSSHGAPGGYLLFGDGNEEVSPEEISATIDTMANKKRFGRMLVILESCFSGVIAAKVNTPGVLVLAASAEDETSKSATYDSELSCWLSDEFTKELISLLRSPDPPFTIRQLYQQLYYHVRSSHPSITRGNESLDIPVHLFFGGDNDETT
jgi:glycosylphosphatidylinositol transamidase (GPIT) subunit GPI8